MLLEVGEVEDLLLAGVQVAGCRLNSLRPRAAVSSADRSASQPQDADPHQKIGQEAYPQEK
jgi:hypothetical protein